MKKHFWILLLTLSAAIIVNGQSGERGTPYMTKSLASESIKDIVAKTSGGYINVEGGYATDARVEVYITSNNGRELSKEDIQERLADYELSVSASAGKLTAIAKAKTRITNWRRALSISFKIFVPQNVSTDLSTSGGSISLNNLSGTEDFSTSGGSLTVQKITGKITGETSGGSINVSDSKDDIDLETSGGSIDASDCTGKIKLNTSGGSLTLRNLNGDVKATTSGGSVDGKNIMGELNTHTSGGSMSLRAMACSLDASTSGGNIEAEITEIGKYVRLSNSGGKIDLEIPKNKGYDLKVYGDKINNDFTLEKFSGTIKEDKIEGTVNGGGIPVTVDAGGGKVYLSFR